jgi:O-antigen/teichoic acid export membrane protein
MILLALFIKFYETKTGNLLLVGSISLFFLGFNKVRMGILKGCHEIIKSQLPEKIILPFIYISLILFVFLFTDNITTFQVLWVYIIALILTLLAGIYILKKYVSMPLPIKHQYPIRIKEMAKALLPFSLLAGLGSVNQNIDLVIIGSMMNNSDVAIFKIAFQIGMAAFMFGIIINNIIAPRLVDMYHKEQWKELQQFISTGALIGFILTGIISLVLFLVGQDIIIFFYGEEYTGVWSLLLILLFSKIGNAFFGPTGTILMMIGLEKTLLKINFFMISIRILLDYFLIYHYGLIGAAAGIALTSILHSGALWYILLQKTQIDSSCFGLLNKHPFKKNFI